MPDVVNAAGIVTHALAMGAQARQVAAARIAQVQAQHADMAGLQAQQPGTGFAQVGVVSADADFEPISGVSLERFAAITKGVTAYNFDQGKLIDVAAQHGVAATDWENAARGWNDRIRANPAVVRRFNLLYRTA